MASVNANNQNAKSKFSSKLFDFFAIDIRMLPSKISYLLYGGVLGSHVPFLTVFFVSVGLSTGQAGFINGMRFAPSALAGPLWGMLADYTGKRKLIVVLLCLGSAIPLFSMPWISRAIYTVPMNTSCSLHANVTYINENVLTNHSVAASMAGCLDTKEKMAANNSLFYVLLCIVMFGSVFVGPLPGYIDSIVMNIVKSGEPGTSYGAQRIFGSLGFSLASFVAGVASDNFNHPNMSPYTAVFFIFLPSAILLIPIGCYLVGQTRWEHTAIEDEENVTEKIASKSKTSLIISMLGKFDILFFLSTAMISGVACNLYVSYTILLASDVIKATQTEMSLMIVIGTAAEVVLFPFTSKLITILGGTSVAMTIGIFSYFVRFMVMSYTKQLWLMVSIQTLHAFGFALTWAAMMEYLHDVTPNNVVLTMFLIFQSIHFGVAALTANIAGGYLYQSYGGRALFRGMSVVCGVWVVMMVMYYGCKTIRNRYTVKSSYERIDEDEYLINKGNDVTKYGSDS